MSVTGWPFRLSLVARFLAVMAGVVAPVALAFGVLQDLGGSARELSVVVTSGTVPLVAFVLVGGVVADRFARSVVITIGLVLAAIAEAALAGLVLAETDQWWLLAVAAFLSGTGVALMNPALAALVPELVGADELHAANGLVGIVRNTARIVGLVGSGVAVATIGSGPVLLGCGTAFAVAALIFLTIRTKPPGAAGDRSSFVADLREGWVAFSSRQWLWVVVAQSSLHFAAHGAALAVIGPVLALADVGIGGARGWAVLLAAEAAGTLVGAVVAMRWKPRRTMLAGVLAVAVTMPVPFVLMGCGAPRLAILVAMFLTGVGMSLLAVLWAVTVQAVIPTEVLSRVSSYDSLGSMLMSPLGLLAAGPLVVAFGPQTAMLCCGVFLVVATSISLLSPEVRQLTPATTPASGETR